MRICSSRFGALSIGRKYPADLNFCDRQLAILKIRIQRA